MSRKIHRQLVTALSESDEISLNVDIWSNRQMRSYIGITAHFLINWKLHDAMLACKRFKGRHTADSILSQYEEVLHNFGIAGKLNFIITDNASNMIKAFKLPGYNYKHRQNIDGEPGSSDSSSSDSEDEASCYDSEDGLFNFLPTHQGCFAHTLQLVVKDGMKEAGSLNKVIAKVAGIISYVRKSAIATESLSDFKKLQPPNTTRWNSELTAIRSILAIPPSKLDELNCPQKLSIHERNLLQGLCEVLGPFKSAVDYTQGNQIVTSSFVLPCIRGLMLQLDEMKAAHSGNGTLSKMLNTFVQSATKRFATYENSETFKLAAALDPRFKCDWCINEELPSLRNVLLKKIAGSTSHSLSRMDPGSDKSEAPMKRRKLFSYMTRVSDRDPDYLPTVYPDVEEEIKKILDGAMRR